MARRARSTLPCGVRRCLVPTVKRRGTVRRVMMQEDGGNRAAVSPRTDKVGVLLLNLGGPEKLDEVQPFLFNLFADPDIIRLPPSLAWLQKPLAALVSTLRAPKSREGYESIGGGSPLRRITEAQAEALRSALQGSGLQTQVYVGMRYWKPFTEDALEELKRDGVTQLVVLPLYPQFSISTSGSSLRLLEKLFKEDGYLRGIKHTVIPSWYERKGYIKAMADLICNELDKFSSPEEVEIFFSAHGVPKSYVEEAGDPYREEMEDCVRLIMTEVAQRGINNHHTLAYQSRVGPVEWLKPYTDESIVHLAQQGTKALLAVPVSFVSEHIETLEEIDVEYRDLALDCGIQEWGRVPALDTDPTFINDLAQAVMEALPSVDAMSPGPAGRVSLVPPGSVEDLLGIYDRERQKLPPPVSLWEWGWTRSAETWNGRIAMFALTALLLYEASSGTGVFSPELNPFAGQ